jgi:hypothetical protein
MSHAFVKEGDDMWLHEIPPTMDALINYLSRENGIRIVQKESKYDEDLAVEVFKMSDGFSYYIKDNKWIAFD